MPKVTRDQHPEIATRFQEGKTLAEIGKDFGISRERVRQILAAQGLSEKYMSQLANRGEMPVRWLEDGRAETLSEMTCGVFTTEDLAALARTKEVAQ